VVINYAKNFLNDIIVHFRVSIKHDGTDGTGRLNPSRRNWIKYTSSLTNHTVTNAENKPMTSQQLAIGMKRIFLGIANKVSQRIQVILPLCNNPVVHISRSSDPEEHFVVRTASRFAHRCSVCLIRLSRHVLTFQFKTKVEIDFCHKSYVKFKNLQ